MQVIGALRCKTARVNTRRSRILQVAALHGDLSIQCNTAGWQCEEEQAIRCQYLRHSHQEHILLAGGVLQELVQAVRTAAGQGKNKY